MYYAIDAQEGLSAIRQHIGRLFAYTAQSADGYKGVVDGLSVIERHMNEIGRHEVIEMHHARRHEGASPASANRLLIMMRYIYNLAIRWTASRACPCRMR